MQAKHRSQCKIFYTQKLSTVSFTAVNETFVPRIHQQEIQEAQGLSGLGDDLLQLYAQLLSVHPSKVEIFSENPDDAPDSPDAQPRSVRVDGKILFFKSANMSSLANIMNAVKKYLRIAELGPGIRTSQLYGIIADDKNPLIGLLLHYIDAEGTLGYAVEPSTPRTPKNQWSTQITDTLTRLHQKEVAWGDVKPDNVLIDKHSDAWIIDFEGGHTEGWVDRDKAGTVEGDLQGLTKIVDFIFEEKKVFEYSDDGEQSRG